MPLSIQAAVVRSPGIPFTLEDAVIDDPRPDELLVRVVATGICHTDAGMRDQNGPGAPFPVVLGHEGAGVVVKTGAGVTELAPGDPVVMSFHSCGRCPSCTDRKPAYCHDFVPLNFSGRRTDGSSGISIGGEPVSAHIFGQSAFATYALCHQDNAVKVPPGVALDLLGPLGCGIQTGAGTVLRSLKVEPGASILVLGAGAVGLSAVMAAKLAGATIVTVVDRVPARLALALDLGATHAVDSGRHSVETALRAQQPHGFDYIVETTGAPAVIDAALQQIGRGGVLALLGSSLPDATVTVGINHLMGGGRSIRGVLEGDAEPKVFIPQLIEHFTAGRFPFDRLIRFYDFEEINRAVADSLNGTTIKPVLRMPR
jgi:aryl-alcohol dehydrogenase